MRTAPSAITSPVCSLTVTVSAVRTAASVSDYDAFAGVEEVGLQVILDLAFAGERLDVQIHLLRMKCARGRECTEGNDQDSAQSCHSAD